MPEVTLSLPIALGLLVLFVAVGAGIVYGGLTAAKRVVNPTAIPTSTETPLPSATPTETPIPLPTATATPLPPLSYTVAQGDTCGGIAVTFRVSVQSIILLNNLPASCNNLVPGQKLQVPQPTPTPLPPPTNTPMPADATRAACEQVALTVQENDTLSRIAANYAVTMQAIKDFNGLATDNVFIGQKLLVPLCMRAATPGPTPTPTTPPPYSAANLLLPSDGAAFTLANDIVTLQWASVGTLRDNEAYQVIVEDITAGQATRLVDYVTDNKYVVPTSFRPGENTAHIMRWWITPMRRGVPDAAGQPTWDVAGAASMKRDFTWVGAAINATPTP